MKVSLGKSGREGKGMEGKGGYSEKEAKGYVDPFFGLRFISESGSSHCCPFFT